MNYLEIKKVSTELLKIIEKYDNGYSNIKIIIKNLRYLIYIINENKATEQLKQILTEISKELFTSNKDMGLLSFYIWKDDYEERIKINKHIEKLTNILLNLVIRKNQ